ncbi:MAG TPA: DUF4142 domain-containing protein [Polyangia bacterium]|jgi:putative membrane protein|nr:DUF4142 domain-containing protein [Polyangia bacterium]
MKTLPRAVTLATITAGLVVAGLQPAHGGVPTTNTRTGTDNTTATEADTGRRAAAAPPADLARGQTSTADEARVVAKIHMVNQMEIEAGRLAKQKAEVPGVRAYGARLERDHRDADQKTLSYARKHKIDLGAQKAVVGSEPDHVKMQETLQRLSNLSGGEFNREFLEAMAEGHRTAIDFVSSSRARLPDAELKTLLSDMLPTLQKHHRIVANLLHRTAGTSAAQPDRTERPSSSLGRRPSDNTRR